MNHTYLALFTIYGLAIGSFLNVCIYRIPNGIPVHKGRSFCPTCSHTLTYTDLIPLFSYISLKGRCRYCSGKISPRYPIIELATSVLFTLAYIRFGLSPAAFIGSLLAAILVVLALIDHDTQEIPEILNLLILALAILNIFIFTFQNPNAPLQSYLSLILGAAVVSLPLFAIAYYTGGFGGGDIKLMAAAGLLLGTPSTVLAFFIGATLAAAYGGVLIAAKKASRSTAIAFGPFLALGIYISYLYGDNIIKYYLSFF